MAKKSRRAKAKQRAKMAKAVEQRQPQQPTQQPMSMPTKLQSSARVSPKAQAPKAKDLTSRYQYVLPDVKRIGIIAGSIIVVLIILSFVLG
ncbi:MAG: hypothetical protein ABSF21_01700 [Dehalococcoidia bacterium]